jgi:hypothetical protein
MDTPELGTGTSSGECCCAPEVSGRRHSKKATQILSTGFRKQKWLTW